VTDRQSPVPPRPPGWGAQPARARVTTPLNADRVVAVAIEQADKGGLAPLTIRAVAAGLGASPMALYRHIGSRDELVLRMADTALGRPPEVVRSATTWQDSVRSWTTELLRRYEQHPWLTEAVLTVLIPSANRARWLEAVLDGLDPTGLTIQQRLDAALLLDGHARNIATINQAARRQSSTEEPTPNLLDLLDPAEFPQLREVVASGALDDEQPQTGQFGAERIIAGLEQLTR
jgi:AcrR family transcriptional regulator